MKNKTLSKKDRLSDFKIKCKNEDFQVTEISLTPTFYLKKDSKYTYLWVKKSGFTTFEILEQLKTFFNLDFSDISNQGLKDEDAITEQLISLKKVISDKELKLFNKKFKRKDIYSLIDCIVGYGKEPLKSRLLHGNLFKIVIRNINSSLADKLFDSINKEKQFYFVNYYDNQRFGMPNGPYNTHLIGKAIVKGDWKEAFKQIKITKNFSNYKNIIDYKKFFREMNPKKVSFFVSAYNSFLWNKQASILIKKNTKSMIFNFKNVGYLFIPKQNDLIFSNLCNIDSYELVENDFSIKRGKMKRNLIISTNIYVDNLEDDEIFKNKKKITLSFYLPTGCYATMVIKQIFLKKL